MDTVNARFKHKPRHFIREWRKFRGYTQEQLAEMVGLTHGNLSQLERGLINYTQPTLESLADALRCDPADLIMRDPKGKRWSIEDAIKTLPADDRDQVVRLVERLQKTG